MSAQPEQPKKQKASGVAIPAGLFIGMGIGFAVDHLVAGLFIGLGAGFLTMIILRIKLGEW
ncbi:MAG TPA: hypothetical protein VMX96_06265 [Dehalococcoidia bacterium]|nr:hypothetical protein [Dehalococcoidia bacterium]